MEDIAAPAPPRDLVTRLKFRIKNDPVEILCERDVEAIRVTDSLQFGPFKRGRYYSVPFWLAMILIEHEHASMGDVDFDFGTLQNYANIQLREQQLQALPDDSLVKFSIWNGYLDQLARKSIVPSQTSEQYDLFLRDLITLRLRRIINMSTSPPTDHIRRNFPREERALLNQLAEIVALWREEMLGV